MEDATLAALLYDDDALLADAVTTPNAAQHKKATIKRKTHNDTSKKKNKPTYYARRDEIKMLQNQVGDLTARIEYLQKARLQPKRDVFDAEILHNMLLRSGLKQTELTLTGVQSILANHRTMHTRNPLEVFIRLSAEPEQRHHTLVALRSERLREATDFILERVQYFDLRRPYRESESFELPNGDHITLQCEVEPSQIKMNVKHVFDDVMLAILQQEFTLGEALGVTTTLESDDADDGSYSQVRGLTTMPDGAQIEKNMAVFNKFSPGTPQLAIPHGLVVIHPVAEDDRYPFQPHLRVRQDMTLVILVSELPGEEGDAVVASWQLTHTYKPQCGISRVQEMRIRDLAGRSCEIIRNNAIEFVLRRVGQA
ncbi:hypothetical protein Poli38472_012350 [Pythium oligandrum]|uniref:Uncharacterized protein n=1 Tax=Pythium oligandrum TaxID=41045 RepID=A0A8K1CQ81_PYTOL|nr:hypothetical protein Poli38472_012350 [Pythium oligandrum]|eukprot:TMW67234.1 hypothetical protein Poli38472_012350 [Pythium oligandrum]